MRERWFVGAMRLKVFLVSLGVVVLIAPSAGAALKKYGMARQILLHYFNTSPNANFNSSGSTDSVVMIDDSGANPVLARFVLFAGGTSMTTDVPALTNGFIWFNQESTEGFPAGGNTGSGSTTSSINWGNLDGWTISGQTYCHAMPSFICDFASAQDSQTIDPTFLSSNYDMGTWTFHGTGWTMNLGYINRTGTTATGFGNLMYQLRGAREFDGTVPTLPLLGIGAVGVSVFAMGVAAMRRRSR